MVYFVLWLYFSTPWTFAGTPQTSGWGAVAVLADEACLVALQAVQRPAWCAPAGIEPSPVARMLPTRAMPRSHEREAL